jgi:hypothetical protein
VEHGEGVARECEMYGGEITVKKERSDMVRKEMEV